ncbi:MAG: site-specific integrase [Bacteroidales bacterium]
MRLIFKVSYYIRSNYKNKEGKSPIIIRIYLNGEMCVVGSSGLSVNTSKWNAKFSRMLGRTHDALSLNLQLDNISSSLNQIFKKHEDDDDISVEKIKNVYLGNFENTDTFLELFNKYNNDLKSLVGKTKSKATYQKYEVTRKRFTNFLKHKYHRNDIKVGELNHIMLHDFEIYLKTVAACSSNTTAKFLSLLKTIVLFAQRTGMMKHNPFENYKITVKKVDRGYLTEEELTRILEKKFTIKRLEQVRDVFIFSCFTGLAYIDVKNLTQENIRKSFDGEVWIMTKRQKTDVQSNVLLLDIPRRILQKYNGNLPNGKILPVLSNQKTNAYLKEIADLCSINKEITFHLARHTFATTVTLAKGVPIETVSKMLGHTNIQTTQIYARITNSKISKDMGALVDKLGDMNKAVHI